MVTISCCQTKKQLKLFERIPELIHENDPYFVPPFSGSITKMFSPKAPFLRCHGELFPLIAHKDGKPVGRIAAIVNRSHNEYYKDKIGFFGFFDSIDDIEVARALLTAAREKLQEKGLEILRGPYSPTVNDECGLLVEGFESIPFVLMPYNPPYYITLYEQLKLQPVRDLYAFYMSSADQAPERIQKIVNRVKRSSGLSLRSINMKKLDSELRILERLYNQTLVRNWGFVPVKYEDLEFTAQDLKEIADPNLLLIAEKNGQAVGFSLVLPNINEFLWKARKSKGLVRFLKIAWAIKTKRPKEARLAILGVQPEFRNSGIAALFYFETLNRARGKKFIGGEMSWVEESNKDIIHAITVMGGKKYKSYRIFEQPLNN